MQVIILMKSLCLLIHSVIFKLKKVN